MSDQPYATRTADVEVPAITGKPVLSLEPALIIEPYEPPSAEYVQASAPPMHGTVRLTGD
jgi:hypothetical protein